MKKRFLLFFSVMFIGFWQMSSTALLQTKIGMPFKNQGAYVLEFNTPYNRITVDMDDNNFTTNETVEFAVLSNTQFVNNKNKPLDRTVIRRGMEIEITGEQLGEKFTANRIKVKTNVEKPEIEVKGYFESLDGERAWIDGRRIELAPDAFIRGEDVWEKKTFRSFNEMELGSEVKVKGTLQSDGTIYANSGQTEPNKLKREDKELKEGVQKNLDVPKNLVGGKGKVLGKEVKFSDSRELQTYITKIGNRLIPRYQKDVPNDSPAKITYRFFVIEDDNFNAFALPDGSIFVHTGLLNQIKNEAQLATVLGHEIAHVTHEHSRKLMDNPGRDWAAIGLLLGSAATGNRGIAAAGALAALAVINKYSQDAENQADRVGLYYMMQAGYDVREAPKIWRELKKNTKENAVNNLFYSGHSLPSQRLKYLNRHIAYSYYDMKLGKDGKEEYDNVVGVHFGWATKKPKVTPPSNQPSAPATTPKTTTPKPTVRQPTVRKSKGKRRP